MLFPIRLGRLDHRPGSQHPSPLPSCWSTPSSLSRLDHRPGRPCSPGSQHSSPLPGCWSSPTRLCCLDHCPSSQHPSPLPICWPTPSSRNLCAPSLMRHALFRQSTEATMEVMLSGGVQQHHVENLLEFDIVTLLSDASGSPLGFVGLSDDTLSLSCVFH